MLVAIVALHIFLSDAYLQYNNTYIDMVETE